MQFKLQLCLESSVMEFYPSLSNLPGVVRFYSSCYCAYWAYHSLTRVSITTIIESGTDHDAEGDTLRNTSPEITDSAVEQSSSNSAN